MKIGILTFHSQQNYGGVLQCYAMKSVLEELGHDVSVIDMRWSKSNIALRGALIAGSIKTKIKEFIKLLLFVGYSSAVVRSIRSIRFVRSLGLTDYNFVDWKDAPNKLGFDTVVVGSDQVWNASFSTPGAYMFEGYMGALPRVISYAASFGMKKIHSEYVAVCQRGLRRFNAISCREKEGVRLCKELGFTAEHVVDPTLLADVTCWRKLLNNARVSSGKKKLVCYFLAENVSSALPMLERFAIISDCIVEVLTGEPYLKPYPKSLKMFIGNQRNQYPHVKIASSYGPNEFVCAFYGAKWILADSFHAVMFSSIFDKNLRFIKPRSDFRKGMFARVEEFATSCIDGPVFVDSVQSALDSFAKGETISYNREEIDKRRTASLEWLKKAIGE